MAHPLRRPRPASRLIPAGGEAEVDWSAPNDDGGSAITGYTVTPSTGGNAADAGPGRGRATSATVTGLTNGTSYTFKVTATNAIGSTDSPAHLPGHAEQSTLFDLAKPATSTAAITARPWSA